MNIIQSGFRILGANINNVFGSPVQPPGPNFNDPVEGLGRVVITGIRMTLIIAGFTVMIYLLWGALDWINSGGEKEKIENAQKKITNAVIGIVVLVAALGIFSVVTGDILGVIRKTEDGRWIFGLPTINACIPRAGVCGPANSKCCGGLTCDPITNICN